MKFYDYLDIPPGSQMNSVLNAALNEVSILQNVPDVQCWLYPTSPANSKIGLLSVPATVADEKKFFGKGNLKLSGKNPPEFDPIIVIRDDCREPHITALHELGHCLDYLLELHEQSCMFGFQEPNQYYSTHLRPTLDSWWGAIQESKLFIDKKGMKSVKASKSPEYVKIVETLKSDLLPHEMFACSFAQFIARKNGKFNVELKRLTLKPILDQRYWDAQDFSAIEAALEAYLKPYF